MMRIMAVIFQLPPLIRCLFALTRSR